MTNAGEGQKRLAIVGAGASGLITLQQAKARLAGWDIVCYEKSGQATGCWGNPHPGFVSTSTKYTTQFTSFRKWDCAAREEDRAGRADFFRDGEYGRYLEDFAQHYQLSPLIKLRHRVQHIRQVDGGWELEVADSEGKVSSEVFTHLVICTGLVARAKPVDSEIPTFAPGQDLPRGKKVVVLGGGESAADLAVRLAEPSRNNRVYLSLRHGVRVSPRYHPIRGVPSDFLRNRLLLSIDRGLRNAIGEKFVRFRMRHRRLLERVTGQKGGGGKHDEKRAYWDEALTSRAKDGLFNVFHTKSDDFLDEVAKGNISVIGGPADQTYRKYHDFFGKEEVLLEADLLCPAIGYHSEIEQLTEGEIRVRDFFLGCLHKELENVFLVGFARPIIGNIPTISEMQAKYITRILSGECVRPIGGLARHANEREEIRRLFPQLNVQNMHPVEMIPYCDRLAQEMGIFPEREKLPSWKTWTQIMLAPVSTEHYLDEDFDAELVEKRKIHAPWLVTALLVLVRAFQAPLRRMVVGG